MANNHSSCGCYGALNTVSGPLTHCCVNASNNSNYENYPYYTGPCPGCAVNAAVTAGNGNNNCGCNNGCNNGCSNCGCGNGNNGCNNCGCGNGCNGCNNCGCGGDDPVPVSNNGYYDSYDDDDDDNNRGRSNGRGNGRGRNNGRGRSNDNDCDDDWDDDRDDDCDDDDNDDDDGNDNDCDCVNNSAAMFEASGTFNIPANTNIPMSPVTDASNIYSLSEEGITIRRSGMFLITYFVNPPTREMVNNEFHLALNGERLAASAILVSSNPGMQSTNAAAQMLVYVQRGSLLSLESQNSLNVSRSDSDLNMFTLSIVRLS